MDKVFSKEKWLESANKQKAEGTISQREIDDALNIWVNHLDGTPQSELEANGNTVRPEWLVPAPTRKK